ncbi:DUF742 domain-containing protein [Streptomyces sp. NPDC058964]|uniref:DUF742 domain-containing protein n=1 Tax=Streptomyces sp. NPDC058964 TaxID=3346681 RepID=UPI0036A5CA0B
MPGRAKGWAPPGGASRAPRRGAPPPPPPRSQPPLHPRGAPPPAAPPALDRLSFERHDIVAACRLPLSIAELAARLRLHLNVVRVLAEDLRDAGQLTVHVPDFEATHDAAVLRRVIDGLRAVPDSRGVLRDTD